MESSKFDLAKHVKEHKFTPVQVLHRAGYQREADFLDQLVGRGLDQDELVDLLIEYKKAFGIQSSRGQEKQEGSQKTARHGGESGSDIKEPPFL